MSEEGIQRINRQVENLEIYKIPGGGGGLKVADILSDPDWRAWLEKVGTFKADMCPFYIQTDAEDEIKKMKPGQVFFVGDVNKPWEGM